MPVRSRTSPVLVKVPLACGFLTTRVLKPAGEEIEPFHGLPGSDLNAY